jgi:2-polyprenyl-3-methyl-5-hydroxy-6-metoxy-1,4-benzoquinol methylase
MERAEWLKQMREKAEVLYDHFSPFYWDKFGLGATETHREYLQKFLERMAPHSALLSAACGAGRFDGMLLEAGHSVVGIDQSAGMLARAREHFPEVRYDKMGLQEMNFREAFDGAICMDAMEHVCPEDWPGILRGFREALKPGGVLYFTANVAEAEKEMVEQAYERAKAHGLPVVFGEVVDQVEEGFNFFLSYDDIFDIPEEALGERADVAVYHYYPPLEQVRAWIGQAGLAIEEQGTGKWYEHFVVRKK